MSLLKPIKFMRPVIIANSWLFAHIFLSLRKTRTECSNVLYTHNRSTLYMCLWINIRKSALPATFISANSQHRQIKDYSCFFKSTTTTQTQKTGQKIHRLRCGSHWHSQFKVMAMLMCLMLASDSLLHQIKK